MNAWVLQNGFGLANLACIDCPSPSPGPSDLLIRVNAVSLNYRDLLIAKGFYNPKLSLPRVMCSDAAGVVEAVGLEVKGYQVGDRVMGCFMPAWVDGPLSEKAAKSALAGDVDGVLAEKIVLPASGVVKTPSYLTEEQAATLPCAAVTAWNALTTQTNVNGKTVLLQGTGGVSLFALQFAKTLGAKVLISSSSDDKLEAAMKMGADAGVNYKTNPDWDKWARQQTGGTGVDLVVEVGGAGTLEKSVKSLRHGGQISLVGVLAGGSAFNPVPAMMKGITIKGIYVGSREMFLGLCQHITQMRIMPVVDKVFNFDNAKAAFTHLESANHMGKVVVKVAN